MLETWTGVKDTTSSPKATFARATSQDKITCVGSGAAVYSVYIFVENARRPYKSFGPGVCGIRDRRLNDAQRELME